MEGALKITTKTIRFHFVFVNVKIVFRECKESNKQKPEWGHLHLNSDAGDKT